MKLGLDEVNLSDSGIAKSHVGSRTFISLSIPFYGPPPAAWGVSKPVGRYGGLRPSKQVLNEHLYALLLDMWQLAMHTLRVQVGQEQL